MSFQVIGIFEYLPQMKTDITLENDTEKIIIDAKFNQEAMTTYSEKIQLHIRFSFVLQGYMKDKTVEWEQL